MTPGEFITKWSDAKLRERAAAQSHFIDLCKMLIVNLVIVELTREWEAEAAHVGQ